MCGPHSETQADAPSVGNIPRSRVGPEQVSRGIVSFWPAARARELRGRALP
jgi:hypothetical protein